MAAITISTNTAGQWATATDVQKGIIITAGGTFVATITVQRRQKNPDGTYLGWVTVDTLTSPTVRVGEEFGLADYRIGLNLTTDYTSGTIECGIQCACAEGFLK